MTVAPILDPLPVPQPVLGYLTALARPVRHEANNLLAVLAGTADILQRSATNDRERGRATRIAEASQRLDGLLKACLSLAAPPTSRREHGTDAAELLTVLRPLVVLMLGPGRSVDISAPATLPALAESPVAVQSAALGLAVQAINQVPPGGGLAFTLGVEDGSVQLAVAPHPSGDAPAPVRFTILQG